MVSSLSVEQQIIKELQFRFAGPDSIVSASAVGEEFVVVELMIVGSLIRWSLIHLRCRRFRVTQDEPADASVFNQIFGGLVLLAPPNKNASRWPRR